MINEEQAQCVHIGFIPAVVVDIIDDQSDQDRVREKKGDEVGCCTVHIKQI